MAGTGTAQYISGQEPFTDEQKCLLAPFVSNFDKPIFVLKNLPEALKGALFSRYSRTTKTIRQLLLEEFIGDKDSGFNEMVGFDVTKQGVDLSDAVKKAESFYQRILDGYGDDSVGELGGAHIACEDISNVASKFLEDARIGGSPLEKSTRYVYFNFKANGDYMFYKEPVLMQSPHRELYLQANRQLFDTYSELMQPVTDWVAARFPMDEFPYFDFAAGKEVPFKDLSPEKQERAAKAYKSALRAHACDILRGLLPASASTNAGIFGNGRFFQELLSKLYSNDLTELRDIAGNMHEALDHVIPAFVKRAKKNDYLVETRHAMQILANELTTNDNRSPIADKNARAADISPVTLIDYDPAGEDKVIAMMLYPHTRLSIPELRERVSRMSAAEKEKIVHEYLSRRRHRRDKPGRALENTYYLFDVLADYGAYRDLQRHRMLSQERQDLTTVHGYEVPSEIEESGFADPFRKALDNAHAAYTKIYADFPKEAQYVVPLQYRIRWYFHLNMRELAHLCELRSMPQGHASYRKIAQQMFLRAQEVHPLLTKYMRFMDMNEYHLGRLGSELKKEEKRATVKS